MSLFLYSLVKHRASNLSEQEGGKCAGAEASLLGTTCVFSSSLFCCCLVYPSTSSPWASCSQRSQHLVPLQNCSSDGVVDFSSASPASRQHCTVNTSLRETTAGESPVSVDGIGHNTHLVLWETEPCPDSPWMRHRHSCARPGQVLELFKPGVVQTRAPGVVQTQQTVARAGHMLQISQSCFAAETKGC